MVYTHNIGIQMNQKELTETFMMISNWRGQNKTKAMSVFQKFDYMCLSEHIMKIINFHDKAAILLWTKLMLS